MKHQELHRLKGVAIDVCNGYMAPKATEDNVVRAVRGEANCMLKSGKVGRALMAKEDDSDDEEEDDRLICTMSGKGWEPFPFPIIVDSSAYSSTLPKNWCGRVRTWQTAESRSGQSFTVANGIEIPNLGRKAVTLMTKEGNMRDMRFEVCGVTRAIGSVSQICRAGHRVVFNPLGDRQGSYIQHLEFGDNLWLTERDGIYMLDVKVAPENKQAGNHKDFVRRGN